MSATKIQVEPVYPEIGRRIQQARDRLGMSQTTLGKAIGPLFGPQSSKGLTRAGIANIEGGKQRILVHTLLAIAEVLRTPLLELLPYNRVQEADASGKSTETVQSQLRQELTRADADRLITLLSKGKSHELTIRQTRRRKDPRSHTPKGSRH